MAKIKGKGNGVLGIVAAVAIVLLVVGILTTSIMLLRTPVKEVSASAYAVGTINDRGVAEESEASIYTKDFINAEGLRCTLDEEAEITYKVYFYDADKEFISATDELSADLTDADIPETAEYAKIVITPVDDEDGVSFLEKSGYAKQLMVTSYRAEKANDKE